MTEEEQSLVDTAFHNGESSAFSVGHRPGLTKREYFAAMAMQGILANPQNDTSNEMLARVSVSMGDAVLLDLATPSIDTPTSK